MKSGPKPCWFLIALLCVVCAYACAKKAPKPVEQQPPVVLPLTFGSQTVLDASWTPAQLEGKPEDKQMGPAGEPDQTPPARTTSTVALQPLTNGLSNNIRSVVPSDGRKIVALTFDLCEVSTRRSGYDNEIVNILRARGVKATFFAGGKWMRSHPEQAMQLMADPLFEIGNHTWTHGNLGVIKGPKLEEQVMWTQAEYELLREQLLAKPIVSEIDPSEVSAIPDAMHLIRLPYGRCNPETMAYLAAHGLAAIQWDVDSRDAAPKATAESIAKRVLYYTRPGSIVLMHGNGQGPQTSKALPLIITKLQAMGYSFVTISELVSHGQPISTRECYYNKPGDNLVFDEKFGDGTNPPTASE